MLAAKYMAANFEYSTMLCSVVTVLAFDVVETYFRVLVLTLDVVERLSI